MASRYVRVFRDAARRFSAAGSAFTSQAIAFTALFALVPLTLIAVAMLAFVYGTDDGIARAHTVIQTYVPAIGDLVSGNLDAIVRYRGVSGAIGIVGLIWSGKNLFQALTFGLNRSLGITQYRHYVWDVLLALVFVPFAGVVLIVATVLPVAVTLVASFTGLESLRWAPQIASYAGSAALVFVVAALLYYYLPNRRSRWRVVLPGALVCTILYSLGQIAFAVYTSYAAYAFQIYGALSALVVLLLWLDLVGVVFLFGAHVSAAWESEEARTPLPLAS
ncbi:MAG TPA: YihY/virulence factor BrkB family protein [Candidatus Baltobacteraceae bacterium]|nr:YihY/virulence factor BrkB family protein [Candidatus Baltobacteraceae bacterium]